MSESIPQIFLKYFYSPESDRPKNIHQSALNSSTLFNIRIVSLIYLTAIFIWALSGIASFNTNIIYFTMQCYFLTWLYFFIVIEDYILNRLISQSKSQICDGLKYWAQIIFELAMCCEVVVTIVFWAFLFKILLNMQGVTGQIIAVNANLHAGPFICLSLDMIYNPFSFHYKRVVICFVFGALYMIINCIYSLEYKVIYAPIDWKSITSYVIVLMSFLISGGVFFLGRFIFKKFKQGKYQYDQNHIRQGLVDPDNVPDSLKVSKKLQFQSKQNLRDQNTI